MKQTITIALLLCSIGVFAQTKVDTNQVSKYGFIGNITTAIIKGEPEQYHFTVMRMPKYYTVNWDSVKTVDDIKILMKALNIQVSDNVNNFKEIKKYLTESK